MESLGSRLAIDDLFVPLWQNNMLDPSTMGGQHFLLDTANLSGYIARECNDIPHVYYTCSCLKDD